VALALLAAGCAAPSLLPPPPPPQQIVLDTAPLVEPPLATLPADSLLGSFDARSYPRAASRWVDSVFETLTLRQRVAQMVTVFAYADARGRALRDLRRDVTVERVGGVILSLGGAARAARLVTALQSIAPVPLLFSADFENGAGMRLRGTTSFPSMMALGATGDPDLAYAMGRAVADESRAIGVRQNYAPVADVNVNPGNPVINVRSFGGDPDQVAVFAESYMRGLQDGRMIATAKHFPGHGDTHVDSHSNLPTLDFTRGRLDSIELRPFRHLVGAGVLAVMTGHLAVPALDPSARPATLSRRMVDTLLRAQLGFRGLVVTDALNMKAVARSGGGSGAMWKDAVLAGADVLLMPTDAGACIDTITAAVERGEIPVDEINRSARRILSYKEWAGLALPSLRLTAAPPLTNTAPATDASPLADTLDVPQRVADSLAALADTHDLIALPDTAAHRALARTIARRSITLVRNDGALVPIISNNTRRVALLCLTQSRDDAQPRNFIARLREKLPMGRTVTAERTVTAVQRRAMLDSLADADILVIASFVAVRNGSGEISVSADQQQLVDSLRVRALPTVACALGSPYVAAATPWAQAIVCGYGADAATTAAMADVLAGSLPARGRLPVDIPGIARMGGGLRTLAPVATATGPLDIDALPVAGIRDARLAGVDSLIEAAIAARAFPGGQLVVGTTEGVLHARAYGHLTYDSAAAPVTLETIYDVASVSKVVATTTIVMRLVEEGRLDLDAPVARYVPDFAANGKADVRVRNLLLHNAGLAAWRPYYTFIRDARALRDTVLAERLEYIPGTRTVYSDLGMITLAEVITRITGERLDTLARRWIFDPLAMHATMYTPADSLRERIAPTEVDTIWRRRLVHGDVHDETAALMGGVTGHAGLFSTAPDLARFARMILTGGAVDGTRIVRAETIDAFTRRAHPGTTRALGWDTKSSMGSSAGRYFSSHAFGHTGFTGTSIWIDPETGIYVLLLTNRVHPTRNNRALLPLRAVVHDAVREALAEIE
jgi:beta-N-acetylhexosaminidase